MKQPTHRRHQKHLYLLFVGESTKVSGLQRPRFSGLMQFLQQMRGTPAVTVVMTLPNIRAALRGGHLIV